MPLSAAPPGGHHQHLLRVVAQGASPSQGANVCRFATSVKVQILVCEGGKKKTTLVKVRIELPHALIKTR